MMNKKSLLTIIGIAVAALVVGVWVGRGTRSTTAVNPVHDHTAAAAVPAEETVWTCSMHPQIQQTTPGDCPICGMDLIPLVTGKETDAGPRSWSMSESSKTLAGIQTTPVQKDFPEAKIRLVGRLDYDETLEKSLTARFPARIDELFVNYKGILVAEGDHLARVYSPDLFSAQLELLNAYRSDPTSSITRAAREKLRLWDLSTEQIDAILENGEATDHFVLKAPIGGVVVEKNVKEGDYVETGDSFFRIVDMSHLWAYLDAYESDLPWLRYGQDVAFSVEAMPGKTFHGQIAFIEPEVSSQTRTTSIRVNVPNPDSRLKPGMFVRGIVTARLAGDGSVDAPEFAGKWISPMHPEIVKDGPGQCDVCGMDLLPAEALGYVRHSPEEAPLIIPTSAVLRTGKRAVVYVEQPDAETPTYEGREIVLGPRAGDYYLVTSGLEAHERVVTRGAFKIDSALQIQAKPSMMNPTEKTGTSVEAKFLQIPAQLVSKLLSPYLAMQSALADDDLSGAKTQAKTMLEEVAGDEIFTDLFQDMMGAEDLESFRRPHFEHLSESLIKAVRESSLVLDHELIVAHCPMVYPDRGADWLQLNAPLRNPYFGESMLRCGRVEETLSSTGKGDENHAH